MTEEKKHYSKNKKLLVKLSEKQKRQLYDVEQEAIAQFSGDISTLMSALGFLRIGHQVGWRVLVITHNKRTIRKYEDILGINIREFFPEEALGSERSLGLKFAKKIGNFWKVVSGDIKVPEKREIV